MVTGLWMLGVISLGAISQDWEETLYVEGEVASRVECLLRLEKGWHAKRETEFETLTAYWPAVQREQMWNEIGLEAVHRDKAGRIIQLDTVHFQHRFRYRAGRLVSIHTRDDWEEHEYIVVWKDRLPVRLVGYLEHIEFRYNADRLLVGAVETWLDEPEVRRKILLRGSQTDSRFPLPFSMGWLFTREGSLNSNWLVAWWLSKQRFSDASGVGHQSVAASSL